MTIEEIKAILGRVRFVEGQIEDAGEELLMLKAKALKVTSLAASVFGICIGRKEIQN